MQPQLETDVFEDIAMWRQDATMMMTDVLIQLPTVSAMRILGAVQDKVRDLSRDPFSDVAEVHDLQEAQSELEHQIFIQ